MYNPNSAIERVKNHLAYKLGQAMIDFTNNGGGYIALFKKLYKIKKQHKKEQKIYQQTIQIFPQLKYPSLETCGDYEQALRYKFHLSYMLGEVLIKADKTWHKGSGFKLKNDIKKANKEFQIFREIFKEFDQINSSILEGLINNKQLFLKEFPRIKNILKIHQDYKAILDNIFHNFNYFIQNFDLIEEWLLSDDFNERYKKGSHPYPSLLDPKKLNDENEKINYKNIPAELAWEMNLPLPDRYEFIMVLKGCSGHTAFSYFLLWSGYSPSIFRTCNLALKDPNVYYINKYQDLIFFWNYKNILVFEHGMEPKHQDGLKLFYLVLLNKDIYILTRDPLSRLKTWANHIIDDYVSLDTEFSLDYDFSQGFKWIKYAFGGDKVDLNQFVYSGPITNESMSVDSFISKINYNKIFYIDFHEIYPEGMLDVFKYFKDNYNFPIIQNMDFFQYSLGGSEGYLF
ncbi:sugar transferase, partial [Campylobacter jejuni]